MNKLLNSLLLFILLFFMTFHDTTNASVPVIIDDNNDSYPLGLYFEYFEDKSVNLSFKEILSPEINNRFKQNDKKIANFGKTKSAYWFRFTILNKMSSLQELLLESSWPLYDKIDLYIQDKSGSFIHKKYGNIYPFFNREIIHRNFIFKIAPPLNSKQTIYIRIETETSMQAPFVILKNQNFLKNDLFEFGLLSIFFGILLIMALYNFIIYVFIRDTSYLIYVVYIFLTLLFQFSFNGMTYNFLWPNHPWWGIHSMPFFEGLTIIFSLLLAKSFLKTKEYVYRINILFNILIVFLSIITLASLFTIFLPLKILSASIPLTALLFIITSAMVIKKNYQPAKFFFIAWIFLVIGVSLKSVQVLNIFKNIWFLENHLITAYAMHLSIVLETLLLSMALANKITTIQREKIEAQKIALKNQTTMTNAFARFVPKEFLTFLNKESIVDVALGNQVQKHMTVLFSDIRSFTALSEKMSPQENFNFLNSYLKRIGPIVRTNNGFIDKYIGDAVMALFPESPENAIDSAIQMQRNILEYNTQRKKNNYQEILIGIGLHSGNLILGTIGEENRMEGTVISDDVNLASRIESLTKYYGVSILISGRLFKQLQDKNKYNYRVIDTVIVKGKNNPVTLIEILDEQTTNNYDLKISTKSQFIKAIKLYRNKSIKEALNVFNEISLEMNGLDNAIEIHIERCKLLLENGISEDWNGIERLDSK